MKNIQTYRDRREAGRILAEHIRNEIDPTDCVIIALARGGVPVGCEVARALGAPLDVFVVRKLGVPGHPELAMGAIASGGREVLNESLIAELRITPIEIADVADRECTELQRRETLFHTNHPAVAVRDRTVILIDDGLATGFTMRAAIAATRERHPKKLVVAVPVGAEDTCEEIAREVDVLICPLRPEQFHAVGLWYVDFEQTSDEEVRSCLAAAEHALHHAEHESSDRA